MSTPPEMPDINPVWAAVVAIGAVFFAWVKKANPRPLVTAAVGFLFDPVVAKHLAPINAKLDRHDAKLDRVCRVIDHMGGANEAHEAVRAEDDARKARWES